MQFRTTTLMFVVATVALPLTLSAPAGPVYQGLAMGFAVLGWTGVVVAALACDSSDSQGAMSAVSTLTAGFFCIYCGALGVCYCIAHGMAKVFS